MPLENNVGINFKYITSLQLSINWKLVLKGLTNCHMFTQFRLFTTTLRTALASGSQKWSRVKKSGYLKMLSYSSSDMLTLFRNWIRFCRCTLKTRISYLVIDGVKLCKYNSIYEVRVLGWRVVSHGLVKLHQLVHCFIADQCLSHEQYQIWLVHFYQLNISFLTLFST